MNYTIATADHATHLRVVLVALMSSIAITWIAIALSMAR
jgi:hypothetical protein